MTVIAKTLLEHMEENECQVLFEDTSHEELRDLDKKLPSDTHLVRYRLRSPYAEEVAAASGIPVEDMDVVMAVRAYKKADIFDALHDAGYQVLEITQGYGRHKPKLWRAELLTE